MKFRLTISQGYSHVEIDNDDYELLSAIGHDALLHGSKETKIEIEVIKDECESGCTDEQ